VSEQCVERRLAAILAPDVAGYSRLLGANEVATLRAPAYLAWGDRLVEGLREVGMPEQ
jgi:hypothetical protein